MLNIFFIEYRDLVFIRPHFFNAKNMKMLTWIAVCFWERDNYTKNYKQKHDLKKKKKKTISKGFDILLKWIIKK